MLGLICIGLIFGVATACSGSKKKEEKSVKQKPLKRGLNVYDFDSYVPSSSKRDPYFDYYIPNYNNNQLTPLKKSREKTFTSSGYDEKRQVCWRRTDTWLINE